MPRERVEKFDCPDCGEMTASSVLYTRGIRRRRECLKCGRRFNTREVEEPETRAEPHVRPPSLNANLPL
jgi:predicted RNA-binding Zn-ribbon protein involved in translation (DUF1610 family)